MNPIAPLPARRGIPWHLAQGSPHRPAPARSARPPFPAKTRSLLPHKHPDENLPGSFADRFFKSVSRANVKGIEELSSVDILAQIAETEADLNALRNRLKEAQEREAREAKAKEAAAADDAERLALEQEREALEAKIAAKKAKRT